ncbi:MAG: SRPBCC domain-containing protein, partial [Chloroflexia bacterium]
TTTVKQMDVKPGGVWLYCMYSPEYMPDGSGACGKSVYTEVLEPEKLVYNDYFTDEVGKVNETMPVLLVTVLFTAQSNKTKVTSIAEFESPEDLEKVKAMGMEQGVTETWDRLEELLAQA